MACYWVVFFSWSFAFEWISRRFGGLSDGFTFSCVGVGKYSCRKGVSTLAQFWPTVRPTILCIYLVCIILIPKGCRRVWLIGLQHEIILSLSLLPRLDLLWIAWRLETTVVPLRFPRFSLNWTTDFDFSIWRTTRWESVSTVSSTTSKKWKKLFMISLSAVSNHRGKRGFVAFSRLCPRGTGQKIKSELKSVVSKYIILSSFRNAISNCIDDPFEATVDSVIMPVIEHRCNKVRRHRLAQPIP